MFWAKYYSCDEFGLGLPSFIWKHQFLHTSLSLVRTHIHAAKTNTLRNRYDYDKNIEIERIVLGKFAIFILNWRKKIELQKKTSITFSRKFKRNVNLTKKIISLFEEKNRTSVESQINEHWYISNKVYEYFVIECRHTC